MNTRRLLLALITVLLTQLTACASLWHHNDTRSQSGSAVEYLFPDAKQAPQLSPGVTTLRPPVKVGIAFAPPTQWGQAIPEQKKMLLLEKVRASFTGLPYIGKIEVIPSSYLRAKGGFTNLEQVARMFDVDVVALVSYDQVQFVDNGVLSMLYWTIVGAYVIQGDRYDVQTMVDAAVFDVASKKLLFRAPGTSRIKGSSTLVNFSEASREARTAGFNGAVDDLIPNLKNELDGFRQRMKSDSSVKVENRAGYSGGGSTGLLGALALLGMLALAGLNRRR
ncbi:rhombotarget lipoprotein [Niveibacterium sp. 24ML]|uniref:rhombotarget lipoprotein n=1 Tax=Niveibacterium sp. 24ML TaxID=2985512 RepID=UPI00226E1F9E|nr:rhombotarget lipoprotein [Niveibacterium sp. 24ML]MCX9158295.1 rhombotarget lipoprotein [Niveibacterium sp. 24ML]